jgi:hypothetical protein
MNKAISTPIAIIIVLIVFTISIGFILLGYIYWPKQEVISGEQGSEEKNKGKDSIIFENNIINQGENFIIVSSNNCVASIKLKLVEVLSDSIMIDILEDESFDGKFYPRGDEIERKEIKTGVCIFAAPLCMDVWYKYCFDINKNNSQIILEYEVEGGSSMPLP